MFPSQPLKKLKGEVMLLHHPVVVNEQQPSVSGLIPASSIWFTERVIFICVILDQIKESMQNKFDLSQQWINNPPWVDEHPPLCFSSKNNCTSIRNNVQ